MGVKIEIYGIQTNYVLYNIVGIYKVEELEILVGDIFEIFRDIIFRFMKDFGG